MAQGLGVRRFVLDDLHLVPVIGKLAATIQTHDIRAGEGRGGGAIRSTLAADRETQALVPAAKQHVQQIARHFLLSPRAPWL